MKARSVLLGLALAILGCSSDNSENIGEVKQEMHAWSTYHWAKTGDQVSLKLSENLTSDWEPYLNVASSDWNTSTVLETTVVQGFKTPKQCKPTLGRVEVCNSAYGRNGWLGIAQIWISGGHISQGVVKVNDSYFKALPYNTPGFKHLVMCQEVGHTFGLDHQDENQTNANLGTCMDYTTNPSGPPSNEHPNAHDYEELENIYAHVESTSTTSNTVSSESEEPGELVEEGNHSQKFSHKLGNNEWLITHVLLAD